MSSDTIFALSSGAPPAAIAVVRISGPRAHEAAAQVAGKLPQPREAALRLLRSGEGQLLDEALVLRFDAPATATGENLVEFQCHGGRAVVAAVLGELARMEGLREAEPGEFTRRALINGRIDLTEAEGLADLLEAETEAQRRAAINVVGGAIRRQVEQWRERLVMLSAQAEAAIDYVGDEDETRTDLGALSGAVRSLGKEMRAWLDRPRAEPLRRGIRVVLAGPPNAGKSSLLNALVGVDRAIVSDEAGTTRDVIETPMQFKGLPFVLVDTAGLRGGASTIELEGIRRAEQQAAAADILLWLGDPADAPAHPRLIRVHAQADRLERRAAPAGSLPVSAITAQGLTTLIDRVVEFGRNLTPNAGVVALNDRQADELGQAAEALEEDTRGDLVLLAEQLRRARVALDRVTGRSGVEDVLDALFDRFCLGK